jgi:hypothetical protein
VKHPAVDNEAINNEANMETDSAEDEDDAMEDDDVAEPKVKLNSERSGGAVRAKWRTLMPRLPSTKPQRPGAGTISSLRYIHLLLSYTYCYRRRPAQRPPPCRCQIGSTNIVLIVFATVSN